MEGDLEEMIDEVLSVDEKPINDRGDGPAQIVIEKNIRAQAQRRADATKEELQKITQRIDKTMAAFELNEKLMEDQKAAFFVPDLIELEKIISDAIQKRRYQQQVMIFIVGYEDVSDQRLKTLTQINDFFTHYVNNIDEKELVPRTEVDLEEASTKVQEAMETATKATEKLTEIKDEMSSFVDKLQGGKLASKSKKKLEKALVQAKEDIMNLTEKLMGAHTEIEDKEDAMTKLYKQLDLKNIEVMKYKNLAEKAKQNTGQYAEELKDELEEKDAVIEELNKCIVDQELTIKQMESMRENNSVKLQNAVEENQEKQSTIEKLQAKVKNLEVLLEDTKTNLFKQHRGDLEAARQDHLQEIELLKVEYQEKIDTIEQENQIKQWASDSEEESEIHSSLGRKSNLESRRSNRSRKDGKLSRQASSVQKKSAAGSRQTSAVIARQQPQTTPATGETMSKPIPDPAKVVVRAKDEPDNRSLSTPKRGTRNVSNLEPVHEVPFEGKIPIEEEEQWEKVPKEQMPSAFKQYRKEALFIVKGLQSEIQKVKEENHHQVNKLKTKVKEKEEKWEGERQTLMRQVGTIEKLRQEAEKEADQAVAQLEDFVKEQEKVAQLAEAQEKKALKKLTPEQRAKYMGEFQPTIPSIDEISGGNSEETESKVEATEKQPERKQPEKKEPTKTKKEEDASPQEKEMENQKAKDEEQDGKEQIPEVKEPDELRVDGVDMEQQTTPIETQAKSLQTSRQSSEYGDDESVAQGFDKERPLSASSQRSIYEKYKNLLEQRKAEIVERRSRATSMHGSLLSVASAKSGEASMPDVPFPDEDGAQHTSGRTSSKLMSAATSYHRDQPNSVMLISRAPSVSGESGVSMHEEEEEELMFLPIVPAQSSIGCMADVDKQDIALSPIALSTSSGDSKASDGSKKSMSEVADHPIVQDYLKTYGIVNEFKEALSRMLADKDLMYASEQLTDIKDLEFNKDKNVRYQVAEMTMNVQAFMKEASGIVSTLLSANDYEAPLSDLVSRANTSKTRLGVDVTLDRESIGGLSPGGADSRYPSAAGADPTAIKQLQDKYDNIQQDLLQQRKDYEERLNQNAVVMMEMQDTIQELQQEMAALGGTPPKFPPSTFSRGSSATGSSVEPSIIFSRLDADRNQKALKRGLSAQKVSHEQYNEAVKIMDQYTLLPAKRLVHLVKKYTHHAHMKAIEENVRHSSALDDEVFHILEKMETLQNMRAQRWGEEMDGMAAERMRLSHLLLEALSRVEQESGIFMIKPILSYEGRNQFLHYHNKASRPVRTPVRPTIVPLSGEGTPPDAVPAPSPAVSRTTKSATGRPTTQEEPRIVHVEVPIADKSDSVPIQGSSLNLIGTPPGTMWSMGSSVVAPNRSNDASPNMKNSLINTPRILELDVNRMLIGQNAVSAITRPFQSNDLLVNASNTSVRSYMTIARPSAQPNLRPNRPNSVGNENERRTWTPNNTPFNLGKPASAGSQRRSGSGISVHSRAKSEGALPLSASASAGVSPHLHGGQPLPPIKVPWTGEKGSGDAVRINASRVGSVINEETVSEGRASSAGIIDLSKEPIHHPSPPHTPPGSSLHQSPTPPRLPSATSSVGGGGGPAKASLRSNSRSTVHSTTQENGTAS